jgi:hypothetical protein
MAQSLLLRPSFLAKPVSTVWFYRYLAIFFTILVNPGAGHWVSDFVETTLYCARFKKRDMKPLCKTKSMTILLTQKFKLPLRHKTACLE